MTRLARILCLLAGVLGAGFGVAAVAAAPAGARTVWLCRPGVRPDPCAPGLTTTVYAPDLRAVRRVVHPRVSPTARRVDCFYAYPTVSDERRPYADLRIGPEERSIALYQAARYSQECEVWAPMYRQVTLPVLLGQIHGGTGAQTSIPQRSLGAAFHDFLTRVDPHGPFVVIAHSQGSFLMRKILAAQVDGHPAVRRRMLSAILLGGNVLVRSGRRSGGDFRHIPACARAAERGCVIAFSTFDATPPTGSLFGVSPVRGDSVLCVDPADLLDGPGSGILDSIVPSAPFASGTLLSAGISLLHITLPQPSTTWVQAPGAFASRCTTGPGAHVLFVTPRGGAPFPSASPTAAWGLHLLDANIALGDLVTIVGDEARAYLASTAGAGSR